MSEYRSFEPEESQVDLSAFDDDFDSVEAPSYDEVPDGKYQVRIDSVRLESSQKGDPMIKWDLIVLSGSQCWSAHLQELGDHSGCRFLT